MNVLWTNVIVINVICANAIWSTPFSNKCFLNKIQTNAIRTNAIRTNAIRTNVIRTNIFQTKILPPKNCIWILLKSKVVFEEKKSQSDPKKRNLDRLDKFDMFTKKENVDNLFLGSKINGDAEILWKVEKLKELKSKHHFFYKLDWWGSFFFLCNFMIGDAQGCGFTQGKRPNKNCPCFRPRPNLQYLKANLARAVYSQSQA